MLLTQQRTTYNEQIQQETSRGKRPVNGIPKSIPENHGTESIKTVFVPITKNFVYYQRSLWQANTQVRRNK